MNLEEMLKSMQAKRNGNYYIVVCPECGHREAYIYVDDINKHAKDSNFRIPIRCNRLKNCGKTSYLEDVKIDKLPEVEAEEFVTEKAIEKTTVLARYSSNLSYDFSWRGISNKTLKNNGFIYFEQGWTKWMQCCGEKSFPERHRKRDHSDRDIFIPCCGYDGRVEYMLLRSLKKEVFPKELSINMKNSKNQYATQIWNKKDLLANTKRVYVTEGPVDALSLKDIDQNLAVVGLPGVGKWKNIIKEFENKHIQKEIVICFDNDEAGTNCKNKMIHECKMKKIPYKVLEFSGYKDINDLLNGDRECLKTLIKKIEREDIKEAKKKINRTKSLSNQKMIKNKTQSLSWKHTENNNELYKKSQKRLVRQNTKKKGQWPKEENWEIRNAEKKKKVLKIKKSRN